MGRGRDQTDVLCEQWARVRRELIGRRRPLTAAGYLGAPHCTLGQRRDLHAGSRSNILSQHFPEVYTGEAAAVNRVFHAMPPVMQDIMDLHYVVQAPRNRAARAELMGISREVYWDRLRVAKAFLEGALALQKSVATLSGENDGKSPIRVIASPADTTPR